MPSLTIPTRYAPKNTTAKDRSSQLHMLLKSREGYTRRKYYNRPRISSYKSRKSKHLSRARKLYGVETITPNQDLAEKTGCSIQALNKIVAKGEGAYYSSGSRPNQTAQSWGLARLASVLTAGKAAAVDYDIIESGCDHTKKAFMMAKKARQKYKYGHSPTKRTSFVVD
jgi:hypothetical protein